MATQAYRDWRAAGSRYRLATPIAGLKSLARAHGVRWLGDIGNLDHLTAATPEDHTPFSVTAWPIPLVGYVITACDMDDGPWSDRLLADARTGRAPWIKYLNFRGGNYSIKRYWERRANPDQHLHVSIRSDYLSYVLGAYNPFIAPPTPVQTGAPDLDYNQAQKLDAIFNAYPKVRLDTDGTPDGKGTGQDFPVPLTARLNTIEAKLDALLARFPDGG